MQRCLRLYCVLHRRYGRFHPNHRKARVDLLAWVPMHRFCHLHSYHRRRTPRQASRRSCYWRFRSRIQRLASRDGYLFERFCSCPGHLQQLCQYFRLRTCHFGDEEA